MRAIVGVLVFAFLLAAPAPPAYAAKPAGPSIVSIAIDRESSGSWAFPDCDLHIAATLANITKKGVTAEALLHVNGVWMDQSGRVAVAPGTTSVDLYLDSYTWTSGSYVVTVRLWSRNKYITEFDTDPWDVTSACSF